MRSSNQSIDINTVLDSQYEQSINTNDIVDFLCENQAFFAAPFMEYSAAQFQHWAGKYPDDMNALSTDMHDAFTKSNDPYYSEIAKFRYAICSHENDLRKNLESFIQNNLPLTSVIKNQMNNPAIDYWYQSEATTKDRHNRKTMQLKRQEKEKMIRAELAERLIEKNNQEMAGRRELIKRTLHMLNFNKTTEPFTSHHHKNAILDDTSINEEIKSNCSLL